MRTSSSRARCTPSLRPPHHRDSRIITTTSPIHLNERDSVSSRPKQSICLLLFFSLVKIFGDRAPSGRPADSHAHSVHAGKLAERDKAGTYATHASASALLRAQFWLAAHLTVSFDHALPPLAFARAPCVCRRWVRHRANA